MNLDDFTHQIDALCKAAITHAEDGAPSGLRIAIDHRLEILERRLGWFKEMEEEVLGGSEGCWEDGSGRTAGYFDTLAMMIDAAKPEEMEALALAMYRGRWFLSRWARYNRD